MIRVWFTEISPPSKPPRFRATNEQLQGGGARRADDTLKVGWIESDVDSIAGKVVRTQTARNTALIRTRTLTGK
jgi:hypothetical protein